MLVNNVCSTLSRNKWIAKINRARRVTGVEDPILAERTWFRSVFDTHFPGCSGVIPHLWLPRFCGNVEDPSARALDNY